MSMPHHFPSLVEGPAQAVLIAGTGLSAPDGQTVGTLKGKLDLLADNLGIGPNDDFYDLAEAMLNNLTTNGKSDAESRLWLAEELGMLDDRRWFGEFGLPLSGNTPRHRALARFVVEERIRAIVSLNWDALLETALDSIGLREEGSLTRPWKITEYARVVDATHMPRLAHTNVFPVIKPHGCVRELEQLRNQVREGNPLGDVIFKLTTSELANIPPAQQSIMDNHVNNYISVCPLVGIGWRAYEDYLRCAVVTIAQQVMRTEPDPFTLVDIEWNDAHTEIANAYGKNGTESFAQVSANTSPSTDCILQWLQARFALKRMIDVSPLKERVVLEGLLREIEQPECSHQVQNWADCWLPTWVRICWRAGAMRGVDPVTNKIIDPFDIPVTPRDSHVPLTGMSVERRDLQAAAKLLLSISKPLSRFNFAKYQGGILDEEKQCLYVPLPGWKADVPSSDLSALKPLVDALNGLGFVKKIVLVWLNNQDEKPDFKLRKTLEAQFRRLLPLIGFAGDNSVTWVELDELKGV